MWLIVREPVRGGLAWQAHDRLIPLDALSALEERLGLEDAGRHGRARREHADWRRGGFS
jgi:hypothetical protein